MKSHRGATYDSAADNDNSASASFPDPPSIIDGDFKSPLSNAPAPPPPLHHGPTMPQSTTTNSAATAAATKLSTAKMFSKRILFRNHQKIKIDTSKPPAEHQHVNAPSSSPLFASRSFTSLFTHASDASSSSTNRPARSKSSSIRKPQRSGEEEVLSGEEILTATPTTASSSGGSTLSNGSNNLSPAGVRMSLPSSPRSNAGRGIVYSISAALSPLTQGSPSPPVLSASAVFNRNTSKSVTLGGTNNHVAADSGRAVGAAKKMGHRKISRSLDSQVAPDQWMATPVVVGSSSLTPPPTAAGQHPSTTDESPPIQRKVYRSTPQYSDEEDEDPHLQMDPDTLWNLLEQKLGVDQMMEATVSDLMDIAKIEAERQAREFQQ
eukprot:TRINITY_DN4262_c0_g1_i1.p1 TRINITY_DN4262_c0_g1~~TRINITY_DN4262_c0_g1_i1.p1  ORF type:complete len:379 (+),score=97.48 TRINITY_DN4262_c0_g1_i1:115-1251(+)